MRIIKELLGINLRGELGLRAVEDGKALVG
jgi:hypothetical protein